MRLDVSDPARDPLRDRIIAYLLGLSDEVLGLDDYDAVVGHMASITSFYTPNEISDGGLPGQLDELARILCPQSVAADLEQAVQQQ